MSPTSKSSRSILETFLTSEEVVAKLGVSKRCLQYWDKLGVISSKKVGAKRKRYYSFTGLVQIKMVKALRGQGVSLGAIRLALQRLRERGEVSEAPLSKLLLVTDGKNILVVEKDITYNLVTGQMKLFTWAFEGLVEEACKVIPLPARQRRMKMADLFCEELEESIL